MSDDIPKFEEDDEQEENIPEMTLGELLDEDDPESDEELNRFLDDIDEEFGHNEDSDSMTIEDLLDSSD